MGPNGSGKSTLAYSIAGHPKYTVTGGTVTLDGEDVLAMTVDERARAGLFLAMQYPVEVPGVSVANFLRTAKTAIDGEAPKLRTWVKDVNAAHGAARTWTRRSPSARSTRASPAARRSATRSPSSSCSTRRSRCSTRPTPASTSTRSRSSPRASTGSARRSDKGVLLITHYTRILRYIKPDFVHVFVDGRIAEQGGPELADQLEAEGYDKYLEGRRSDRDHRTELAGLLPELEVDPQGLPDPGAHAARAGMPLVYLDSANTSQKPQVVIDAMVDHLERHNANVARAMHQLGAESTAAFEGAPRQGRGVHQRARRATR